MGISYELSDIGFIHNAPKQWERALESRLPFARNWPPRTGRTQMQFALATTRQRIGTIQANLGHASAVFENFRRAIEIREALVKLAPASTN